MTYDERKNIIEQTVIDMIAKGELQFRLEKVSEPSFIAGEIKSKIGLKIYHVKNGYKKGLYASPLI